MQPVSICTIIKNEEKHIVNYLSAINKVLKNYPHEVLIVDTGSSDDSIKLVTDYSRDNPSEDIRLENYTWTDDFSAAKNHAVSLARYDWILNLDADEYLRSFNNACIDLMNRSHLKGIGLIDIINHTGDSVTYDKVFRLFNRRFYHFEGIIHEQLCPADPLAGNRKSEHVAVPIVIDHYGYAGTEEEKKNKAARNNALLFKMLEKDPDDPYIFYQLGQSYASIHDDENAYLYYGKGLEFDVDEHLSYVRSMVVGYGNAMLNTGRFEEALSFEGIYDSFSDLADFLCLMGHIYLRNGMIENAYSEFENATRVNEFEVEGSNTYLAYYNMAVIDEALGNTDRALTLYKKCGDFKPAQARLRELE